MARGFSLILTGGILAGIPGCSVRKKSRSEWQEKKEVVRLQTDSLLAGSRKKTSEQAFRYFQHIRLSPPDSTGRQYIRTLTQASSAAGRIETGCDSLSLQSATRSVLHAENRQKEDTATSRTFFGWKWIIAGILVLGAGYFLKQRNKTGR